MSGPLDGIRIIDWTIWQQGPVATQMLADLGAEVIKIEERERGDPGRGITAVAGSATIKGGRNYYFEANNKHKKSIALNLKQPEAREIVHRLAARSDVFVQNFRKGVAKRLGLGYADLAAHNPRIIYASASGYGPEGPDSGEPSFDYLGQARSGIMNAVGSGSTTPTYVYGGIADQMGAIMLAYGVLAALFARERTGIGQEVDASHLGSMMALQGLNVVARTIMGKEFPRNTRANAYNPLWNHYRCADDKWISLAMLQPDRYWKDFCEVIGKPELIEDPRFAEVKTRGKNSAALVAIFDEVFATRPRDEWMRVLKGARRLHLYDRQFGVRPARRSAGQRQRLCRRLRSSRARQPDAARDAGEVERDAGRAARACAGTRRAYRVAADRDARLLVGRCRAAARSQCDLSALQCATGS